jgi:hypothetical protein
VHTWSGLERKELRIFLPLGDVLVALLLQLNSAHTHTHAETKREESEESSMMECDGV